MRNRSRPKNATLALLACVFTLMPTCLRLASADVLSVGKAKYRNDLPKNAEGNSRRLITAKPSVSSRIKGAVPTNDWCSSLVWPTHSEHSLAMFPHPLAVKAESSGLGLGYNPTPTVSSSLKDGKLFQSGTSYRFPFRQSMVIGLEGLNSPDCVLDRHTDWTVTALWKSNADELRATFGHGLPFCYFERSNKKPIHIKFEAANIDRNAEPVKPLVFEIRNVTGSNSGQPGKINLSVNAGRNAGIGSKARLRYDYDGDGETDRVETFQLMATDPVERSWETYSDDKRPFDPGLTHGEPQDFAGGTITLEFWKCFGKGDVQVQLPASHVELPIANGKRFLSTNGKFAKRPVRGDDKVATLKGDAKSTKATVFYRDANVLGVTVNKTHYGLFAPTGSTWSPATDGIDELKTNLAGKDYLSVATLPDAKPATIQWFQQFAYAFVTDTRVEHQYNPQQSNVTTTYTATTVAKQGSGTDTVFALYRHQHLHLTNSKQVSEHRYASPRGTMKVLAGSSFSTATPYLGVLPTLPTAPSAKQNLGTQVDAYLKKITTRKKTFEKDDTYWNGKEFGKISEIIQIANQLEKNDVRDQLVQLLERRMEDWFDGDDRFFFYYDPTWNALVGYPDSYGSGDQLNDHHFHYSYFIKAAATIAQFDPDWVKPENYGGMIDLLIRNCANYDRNDDRFPWMRFFDPYAGHSWASGHAGFASGNNQESSSESMNFATSLILYGEATGNTTVRDLGIYWHATEAEAIRNYWFDNDGEVFPKGFGHTCVGMIWGDGGTYGTWWTANPEEIHGINYLPVTGGSLYLGRDPDYTKRNFENLLTSNHNFHTGGFDGDPDQFDRWNDVLHEYLALSDPAAAAHRHQHNGRDKPSEFGETHLHTQQWISALKMLGHFDETVRADHPTAVSFLKNGGRTYVVYNASAKPQQVTFTDKATFSVPAGLHTYRSKP